MPNLVVTYQFLEDLCRENVNSEVGTGNVTIDDTKIQGCIDYINATDCENLDIDNVISTPCEEMMIGSLATDEVCEVDGECAGDAYCAGMNSCGTCAPRVAAGEVCSNDEECTNGKCNSAGVCATAIGIGGACVGNNDCIGNLDCHPITNVCALLGPVQGDACVDDDACGGLELSMYCQRPQLLGGPIQGTCQPLPVVGESCVPLDFLGVPGCRVLNYDWCDAGTCRAPAMSMLGEVCNLLASKAGGARKCNSGLMCSNANLDPSVPGTCVTPGQSGATCDFESDAPTNVCHPFYNCTMAGMCELDLDVTGMCPAL